MKIEIQQTTGLDTCEYTVYDMNNRKIIHNYTNDYLTGMYRHFTDEQILNLLGDKEYNKFMQGKFIFNVTKKQIFDVTNNINYFTMPK